MHEHSSCASCETKHDHGHTSAKKVDWLFWISGGIVLVTYLAQLFFSKLLAPVPQLAGFAANVFSLSNQMWWGVALGILFVGVLDFVPREFVIAILGRGGKFTGILRATFAGVLLDLCSHGILLVGTKLYERGATLGQVFAFLIASPWNSLSLTLILWALLGFKIMIIILLLSMLIAVVSGMLVEFFVRRKILPENPNTPDLPDGFSFFREAKKGLQQTRFGFSFFGNVLKRGVLGSQMILRWILFGTVLAAAVRVFIAPDMFQNLFGATAAGLALTILVATVLEVCSEGSTPFAADFTTIAGAPGNTFAFLMSGVATDYTEIMALRETTRSWKISFFLPLTTLPQVIFLSWLLNNFL